MVQPKPEGSNPSVASAFYLLGEECRLAGLGHSTRLPTHNPPPFPVFLKQSKGIEIPGSVWDKCLYHCSFLHRGKLNLRRNS